MYETSSMRGVQRGFPYQESFQGHEQICLKALACWRLRLVTPASLCLEALASKFIFTTLQQCAQLPSLCSVMHNIFFPCLQMLSCSPSVSQRNRKRGNKVARSVLYFLRETFPVLWTRVCRPIPCDHAFTVCSDCKDCPPSRSRLFILSSKPNLNISFSASQGPQGRLGTNFFLLCTATALFSYC